MLTTVLTRLQSDGLAALLSAIYRRAIPRRLRHFRAQAAAFRGRVGLEVGGPSPIFGPRGAVPVYPLAARIDNCNFGSQTIWEGRIAEGQTFIFNRRLAPGRQFLAEATQLETIADEAYDFVLSSHCLEHVADPIRALQEWSRVLCPGGLLALVMPHRDATFDRRRPITALDHLIGDNTNRMGEDDLTHLDEVLRLMDWSLLPRVTERQSFEAQARRNADTRCLHHHVFDTRLVLQLLDHVGFQIAAVEPMLPCHIVVLARRTADDAEVDNTAFGKGADWHERSPYPSDHVRD